MLLHKGGKQEKQLRSYTTIHKETSLRMIARLKLPYIKAFFLILLSVLTQRCSSDAPHSNPLDPLSPKYDPNATLEGVCTRLYDQQVPVTDVDVVLKPQSPSPVNRQWETRTDASGRFRFTALPPDTYLVVVRKDGFAPDSQMVVIGPKETRQLQFALDALPLLQSIAFNTGHLLLNTPDGAEQYLIQINVVLLDPDRNLDIDSVVCRNDSLQVQFPLSPNEDHSEWSVDMPLDALPVPDPEAYLGKPFIIDVYSTANSAVHKNSFGPYFLIRFIPTKIAIEFPKNDTTVTAPITFRWRNPNRPAFPYVYQIEINQFISVGEFVTRRVKNVTSDSSLTFNLPLPVGKYFWAVILFDNFGNWTRSKDETFTLIPSR
ncbi:MAG: carboxypeptidase-like regulatory domain-containing protein [candidate division KSB1 bacterium]|nr:carboxypeptidase-like regulatory domain-containing protein [candidate division KSB1 bacterium]MDQ7062785.1 carboxypeptidase-like regulatory domain-containing protein [candidate division KSB1 bacterium]